MVQLRRKMKLSDELFMVREKESATANAKKMKS